MTQQQPYITNITSPTFTELFYSQGCIMDKIRSIYCYYYEYTPFIPKLRYIQFIQVAHKSKKKILMKNFRYLRTYAPRVYFGSITVLIVLQSKFN